MIYHSRMINKEQLIRQVGQLFLNGSEASIADQYASSWARANLLRTNYPLATTDELCQIAAKKYLAQVAAIGGGAGAIAAAPYFGTLATIGSAAGDIFLVGKTSVNHVLLLAALHDLILDEPQLRRLTVRSSLAAQPTPHSLELTSTSFVENLNRKLAERVIIKVGAKLLPARASAALPMLVGAAAAASLNAKFATQININALAVIKLQAI